MSVAKTTIETDKDFTIKFNPRKIPKRHYPFLFIPSRKAMNRPQTFVELLCDSSLSATSKKYIPHMIDVCMPEIGYFQLSAKELDMATSNYARMLKPLFDRNIIKKVPANKYTYDDQPLSKGYVFNSDLLVPKDYEKASQLWAKL